MMSYLDELLAAIRKNLPLPNMAAKRVEAITGLIPRVVWNNGQQHLSVSEDITFVVDTNGMIRLVCPWCLSYSCCACHGQQLPINTYVDLLCVLANMAEAHGKLLPSED